MTILKEQGITYSANNDKTLATVVDNNVLHGPCPIPMDLHGGLTSLEDDSAGCELLVAHVCTREVR